MDLKDLRISESADAGAELRLTHPVSGEVLTYTDTEGKTCTMCLQVLGKDSDTYRKKQRQLIDKRLRENQRNRGVSKATVAELENDALDHLASVVVGGKVFLNGTEVSVNSETARTLMEDYSWIREQVEQFVEDRSNFLPL